MEWSVMIEAARKDFLYRDFSDFKKEYLEETSKEMKELIDALKEINKKIVSKIDKMYSERVAQYLNKEVSPKKFSDIEQYSKLFRELEQCQKNIDGSSSELFSLFEMMTIHESVKVASKRIKEKYKEYPGAEELIERTLGIAIYTRDEE